VRTLSDKVHAEPEAGYVENPVVELLPGGYGSAPYKLKESAHYWSEVDGRWIRIEKGFQSDLLSIPWIFTRLLPRGSYGKRAAIVHDWLVYMRLLNNEIATDIFDEALRIDGVPRWRRKAMVWAVRHFGPRWG